MDCQDPKGKYRCASCFIESIIHAGIHTFAKIKVDENGEEMMVEADSGIASGGDQLDDGVADLFLRALILLAENMKEDNNSGFFFLSE